MRTGSIMAASSVIYGIAMIVNRFFNRYDKRGNLFFKNQKQTQIIYLFNRQYGLV